ncbi:MAG: 4'-phosphopantetheinyl transferase family protein [Eubacterium sp.]
MDIYYFNITALRNKNVFNLKLKDIDARRADKIGRLRVTDDKLRCLGAGLLIKFIQEKYSIKGELLIDKFGKPYFDNSKVYFNISHSGNYVVAAVSKHRIGVDVQRIQQDKHRIAEKNFLPSECEYINEASDDAVIQQRFCEIWTIKEAYLKNIGIGLRKPLNSFEISLSGDAPQIIGKKEYRFVQMKLDGRYIIAVCASRKDKDFNIEEVLV